MSELTTVHIGKYQQSQLVSGPHDSIPVLIDMPGRRISEVEYTTPTRVPAKELPLAAQTFFVGYVAISCMYSE